MTLAEEALQFRTLGERLSYWSRAQPQKPFIKCASEWLSYAQTDEATRRLAAGLQGLGLGRGDRVAVISHNSLEMILSLLAIGRMGAISVPLNTYLKGEFLRYQLADSSAVAVLADNEGLLSVASVARDLPGLKILVALQGPPAHAHGLRVEAIPFSKLQSSDRRFIPPEVAMHDAAAIIYTSGTTGMPKGCVCSQGYCMGAPIMAISLDLIRHDDTVLTPFPLFHSAGFAYMLTGALQAGASVCFEASFSASAFMRRATEEGATTAHGVGSMGLAILASAPSEYDRGHRLRLCQWPPMTEEKQIEFETRFATNVLGGGYGQTEAQPICGMTIAEAKTHRRSLGRAAPLVEVSIVDPEDQPLSVGETGEIVVRPKVSDIIFQSYWQKPVETVAASRNLWHHTGDLGRVDADGFYYFVDRKKDAMRRRGENVSSLELEQAILRNPKIKAAATHAVPSGLGDDEIKACLVLQDGVSVTAEELFRYFEVALPYFAVPRYVEVLSELPTTATGRVMKDELRKRGIIEAWDFEKLNLTIAKENRRR